MTVDEQPSATLTASIMEELDTSYSDPPRDEYQLAPELPPAYGSFDDAFAQWQAADNAKQAIFSLEPSITALERELNDAKEALKNMKEKRCGFA
jgi:hypothetical protein